MLSAQATLALILAPTAFGAVELTPFSPHVKTSAKVYYATTTTLATCIAANTCFIDTNDGYSFLDLSTSLSNADATENSDRNHVFQFEATGFTTGTAQLISFYIDGNLVPLVQYATDSNSLQDCDATYCKGAISTGTPAKTYYSSVVVSATATKIKVAFYLEAFCDYHTTVTDVCAAGDLSLPATGEKSVSLEAVINVDSNNDNLPDSAGSDSTILTLSFPTEGGALSCADPGDIYFPGDSEIIVTPNAFTRIAATYAGDVRKIVQLGKLGTLSSSSITQSNLYDVDVFNRFSDFSNDVLIRGFQNSFPGTEKSYDLLFAARDDAGIIGTFTNNCSLSGVKTTSIQGFLKKGNCFIATASYQDPDAWGVKLLRRFRDQSLNKTHLGRLVISFYEKHSPRAAEWVLFNPWIRPILLLILIPFEGMAWVVLHPFWFLAAVTGFWILFYPFRRRILG